MDCRALGGRSRANAPWGEQAREQHPACSCLQCARSASAWRPGCDDHLFKWASTSLALPRDSRSVTRRTGHCRGRRRLTPQPDASAWQNRGESPQGSATEERRSSGQRAAPAGAAAAFTRCTLPGARQRAAPPWCRWGSARAFVYRREQGAHAASPPGEHTPARAAERQPCSELVDGGGLRAACPGQERQPTRPSNAPGPSRGSESLSERLAWALTECAPFPWASHRVWRAGAGARDLC